MNSAVAQPDAQLAAREASQRFQAQSFRLLLVDSDRTTAAALTHPLSAAGHEVRHAASWREGLSLAVSAEPHLILICRALPEVDGLTLVRILRACGRATPLLLLSASNGACVRREALGAGADDHLAKPFAESELLARVAALARPPPKREEPTVLRVADLQLHLKTRTVMRAGRTIRLAPRDFELLAYLMRNNGRAIDRASLMGDVWGRRGDLGHRILEASIRRVRAKVDRGFSVELIHTVPGVGFCLLGDD
jgi:two-component system OmpR family response regulator|nr:two-component system, OmpR family, response regulator [Phenylobacterium sp.]